MGVGGRRGLAAAAATIALSLILLLPLCHTLFDCGCTWPWSGAMAHCNIHSAASKIHCPWCTSNLAGGLSVLPALCIGTLVAFRGDARSAESAREAARKGAATTRGGRGRSARADFLVRLLAGVGAFLLLAALGGWLTSIATGYPRFLLG